VSKQWEGKRGRVDICLNLEKDGHIVIVKIKATNWDKFKGTQERKEQVERLLNERLFQFVWRKDDQFLVKNKILNLFPGFFLLTNKP